MGTKTRTTPIKSYEKFLREELETAWLRGWKAGQIVRKPTRFPNIKRVESPEITPEVAQHAADYAERVVGGSTRPEVES
jgi:hypothetical protein